MGDLIQGLDSRQSTSVELSEQANRVLLIVNSRLTRLGYPVDPFVGEVVGVGESVGRKTESEAATDRVVPFLRPVLTYFPQVGGSGLRTFDLNAAATGDRFHRFADFFAINVHDDPYVKSFVVAPVGNGVGAWLFPVKFPVDIARIAFTSLSPTSERQRFFAYFAGIYCDALAVLGDAVGFRAQLIRSIGLLASFLGVLVCPSAGADRPDRGGKRDEQGKGRD